jgi:hypothetical protein
VKTRKGLKTVNLERGVLPIVVPAERGQSHDGIANFFEVTIQSDAHGRTWQGDTRPIHLLTDEEVAQAETLLSSDELDLLKGTLQLKQGYETDDEVLKRRGLEKTWRFWTERPTATVFPDLIQAFAKMQSGTKLRFQVVVTKKLEKVRIVMWHRAELNVFSPAFFAPDLGTAIFLRSVIDIRSCPYCSKLFLPPKQNKLYCCDSHREAYRMSRYNERKRNRKGRRAS